MNNHATRTFRASLCTLGAILALGFSAQSAEAQQKPAVRWVPAHSSNYTARSSRSIRRIVIHTIEGSEGAAISWFQNRRANVSAHYVVAHSGRITQMLRDSDRGWHAGVSSWNADSIGIENEGYAGRNGWTNAQYGSLAALVRYVTNRYGIPVDRTHIVGHSEVRRGKSDPGRFFDWTRFLNMVRSGSNATTTPITPVTAPSPTSANGRYAVEISASALNVRTGPWGTRIGTAARGRKLVVTGQRSGWLRIDWSGRSGWVHGGYVRRTGATGLEVTASALNVRGGPSVRNGRLGSTLRGQTYVRVSRQGNWSLIQYDNRRGWVHSGYTQAVALR